MKNKMVTNKTVAGGTLFLLLAFVVTAFGQASPICSYRWNPSTDCSIQVPCLDSASMAGKVISVPGNITRIAVDGLKLCLSDQNVTSPADIVYIMDLSGSMWPQYNPSGDPYFKRADAIKAGFDYQVDSVPGSYAGYLGFANAIINKNVSPYNGNFTYGYYNASNAFITQSNQRFLGYHLLSPRNVSIPLAQDSLDTIYTWLNHDQHLNNSVGGTDYHVALSQAATWFGNSTYSPHPNNRVIIFVTDGQPNGAAYQNDVNLLISQKVKIYGVYLGSDNMGVLSTIATSTGGYAITVPRTNTDTLKTVIRNLVKQVTVYLFDTLTVSTNGVVSSALGAIKRTNPPDAFSGWELQLNKVLPLIPGNNLVSVRSLFNSGNGPKCIDYDFTINVDPNIAPTSCEFCYQRSILQILNATTNASLDTLTPLFTSFKVRLSYFGSDSGTL
ncbi:MAG: VWA domain-containing protein, partial [Chitinivibrionales bacterium]|nr:VWA domain-containing protein [Chitinivibrionales bacterium]